MWSKLYNGICQYNPVIKYLLQYIRVYSPLPIYTYKLRYDRKFTAIPYISSLITIVKQGHNLRHRLYISYASYLIIAIKTCGYGDNGELTSVWILGQLWFVTFPYIVQNYELFILSVMLLIFNSTLNWNWNMQVSMRFYTTAYIKIVPQFNLFAGKELKGSLKMNW